MSRLAALATAALLASSPALLADTVTITVDGTATITVQTDSPPDVVQMPKGPNLQHFHHGWSHHDTLRQKLQQMQNQEQAEQALRNGQVNPGGGAHHLQPKLPQVQRLPSMPPQMGRPAPESHNTPVQPLVTSPIEQSELPAMPHCDAEALAKLVGQPLPTAPSLTAMDLADGVRLLAPGQPMTLDRRLNRATIVVDASGDVVQAYCG